MKMETRIRVAERARLSREGDTGGREDNERRSDRAIEGKTYVRGLPDLLVGRFFPVLVVLVVGMPRAQVTDVTLTGLEVSVTAVALEERRRLGDLGGDVEFVLVPVPTGSRR